MNYNIEIPKPCHEDWEAMTPQTQGRFCGSCQKTVVDFTQMQPHEVEAYFAQNQSQHLCGRFNHDQLDGLKVEVPSHLLQRSYSFQRMFVLAFFISMGAGLVSCTSYKGQTKEVTVVEVVQKPVAPILLENITVEAPAETTTTEQKSTLVGGAVAGILIPKKQGKVRMVKDTLKTPKPTQIKQKTKGEVKLQPKTKPEIKPMADTLVLKGYKTVKQQTRTGGVRVRPKTDEQK